MLANVIAVAAGFAGLASAATTISSSMTVPYNGTVTTTRVVDVYTTVCPYATTFEFNGKTYTAEEATTLTITDCPCTITEACTTCTVEPTKAATTIETAVVKTTGEETPTAAEPTASVTMPPVSGADKLSGAAVLAGAALFGLLAL